jgi:histone demethylase JARID1
MWGRGKRAGEGEGNCEVIPTGKQCPSWVVAKFKARWCNPHTGRPLRFLFYHDSAVANYTCCHLFADLFQQPGALGFYSSGHLSTMRRSTPAQSVRGTPRRARTALADTTTPLDSPTSVPVAPKPPTTLISSLEIPVQGALPIPQPLGTAKSPPFSSASAPPLPAPATPSSTSTAVPSGRRAPRRSKTEALAALQSAAHADGADDAQPPAPTLSLFQPDAAPLPAAPRLDMSTVRTPSHSRRAPGSAQASSKERPFALEDCPAFYPTPEDFRDPMSYIRSIAPQAQEYGIAKIVPPETWRMPFVTDTEV